MEPPLHARRPLPLSLSTIKKNTPLAPHHNHKQIRAATLLHFRNFPVSISPLPRLSSHRQLMT